MWAPYKVQTRTTLIVRDLLYVANSALLSSRHLPTKTDATSSTVAPTNNENSARTSWGQWMRKNESGECTGQSGSCGGLKRDGAEGKNITTFCV